MDSIEVLRSVGFLDGIDEEHLKELASLARIVEIEEGKVVFREGDAAEYIYLVTRGNVSLEICAPGIGCRRILTVGKGELLGWSPLLEQSRLTATARTLAPTQVVQMSGRHVVDLCEQNPRLGFQFMRRAALALAKRLSAARLQLLDVYGSESTTTAPASGN